MWRRICGHVLAVVLVMTISGCAPDGPPRGAATGLVTVDGRPLGEGSIIFIPIKGTSGPTSGCAILNGRYEIDSDNGPVVGWNRVEVRGMRKTGQKVPDPRMPGQLNEEVVEVVPAQYNLNSALEREIHKGENQLDFELPSR